MTKLITPAEMNGMLAVASARAEPIIPEGWSVPNGYLLRGPRGNRCTVSVNGFGLVDRAAVQLWVDGIAYGDRLLAAKPRRRRARGRV